MAKKILQFRKREAKIRNFTELWEIDGMNESIMKALKSNFKINRKSLGLGTARNTSMSGRRKRKSVIRQLGVSEKTCVQPICGQEDEHDLSNINPAMTNTPITVILPACHRNQADDIHILAPETLQASPSGQKLTAVYKIATPQNFGMHVFGQKSSLDAFSTKVYPPSTLRHGDSTTHNTRPLSPAKERSIRHWLNTMPRRFAVNKQPTKFPSSPGGLGAEDALLLSDVILDKETPEKSNARKERSRSRSAMSDKQLKSKRRSCSRSVSRKRASKSRPGSRSGSGGRSRPQTPNKGRKSPSSNRGRRSVRSSRRSSTSRNLPTSLRSADRNLRSSGRKPKSYKETSSRKPAKPKAFKQSRTTKDDGKRALFACNDNNESLLHDQDGPLTLFDLEDSDCQENKNTVFNTHIQKDGQGRMFPQAANATGGAYQVLLPPNTKVKMTIRRESRERSRSRESPHIARRSSWKRNEEFQIKGSRDQDRHERHYRRHKHRGHRHQHDRKYSLDNEKGTCTVL